MYQTKQDTQLSKQNRKVDWVIFHEIMETGKGDNDNNNNKVFIRDLTVVERDWLLDYSAAYYQLL